MEGTAYHDLAHACAIKATLTAPDQKDALSWELAPSSIRDILKNSRWNCTAGMA